MKRIKDLTKKDKIKYFVILSLLILLIIGTTYALLKLIGKQEDVNLVETGCFDVTMTNQENAINLDNAFPLTDEQGRTLTPFTFTLKNNCDLTASYNVNLEVLSGSTLSSAYVATLVNNGTINTLGDLPKTDTTIKGSIESRTIYKGILAPGLSVDIGVSIWIDEDVTISDNVENTTLKSKVVVVSTPYLSKGYTGIEGNIVAQLDTTGKCPTVNSDGTVTVTDAETSDGYLCSAPDNYGTSYYYRGNVTNNYVQFGKWADDTPDVVYGFYSSDTSSSGSMAFSSMEECQKDSDYNNNCTIVSRKGKPMYWRIVRINGDGSVRLAYAGTSAFSNDQFSLYKQLIIDTTSFFSNDNFNESEVSFIEDNAGIGYMYGDTDTIIETTTQSDLIGIYQNDYYMVAKEYGFSKVDGFTLKNPIKIKASELNNNYVGYYFIDYDYYSHSEQDIVKYTLLRKFTEITKDDNGNIKGYYKTLSYGTSTKEKAQTNKNDSLDKMFLDNWYKDNIKDTSYANYISDNIFCNDRTISNNNFNKEYITNLGYGSEFTVYRWGEFIAPSVIGEKVTFPQSVNSKLTCSNKNDAFTVNESSIGNGNLTYSIGELTADEAVLAGAYFSEKDNKNYYLYNGYSTNLMSPAIAAAQTTDILNFPISAAISGTGTFGALSPMFGNYGVVPTINLKNGSLTSGDGTINNPYKVEGATNVPTVNIISYIDNKESSTMPVSYLKDKYTVDKVECDNNVTGTWNTDKWNLDTTNLTQDSTCKVYFKSPEADYASSIQIANKEIKVNELSKCPLLDKDSKVKITSGEDTDGYLCGAKDNYGVSYYFRGNVTNNYVKFADKYWRIIRVNGDGTVRMIYDGTSAHANGESSEDRQLGTSAFNSNEDDNAYVGYMYGKVGATSYADTHTNTNDSTIKTYLDNWYKNNISGTSNEQYIADNIFCNDRRVADNSSSGYGKLTTNYTYGRNYESLICSQQNDAFTVSDTTNGNGSLTYPIGLITRAEGMFAGSSDYNSKFYLYSGYTYWNMSPNQFDGSRAYEGRVYESGLAASYENVASANYERVRPVLNLKASALNAGTGTASDPFRIE